MNWAVTTGMLGRQKSLSPSRTGLGTNTYLEPFDFGKMLGIALLLHLVVFGIASIWPEEEVTDIPVRALTFKIGGTQRIAAFATEQATPVAPQPITTRAPSSWRAAPKPVPKPVPKPQPQPLKQAKAVPITPPSARQAPLENPAMPEPAPASAPAASNPLPDTGVLTQYAAIAPTPQRFIREGSPAGAMGGQGATNTAPVESPQTVRERYERQIAGWIQRHKLYPAAAGGKEGRVVIRVRIDRSGYVRYYAIEESSGNAILDAAAVDMIRRANPMPGVPATYPAGNLIEFLIPIMFREPR